MKWCLWCGEPLTFDSQQGWVHQDGKFDAAHSAKPVTHDWKAAERREEAEAKGLPGDFGKLLGCLEDATCWLDKANARFPEDDDEACDNPFWGQLYETTKPLRNILRGLRAVEKHMPKEVTA